LHLRLIIIRLYSRHSRSKGEGEGGGGRGINSGQSGAGGRNSRSRTEFRRAFATHVLVARSRCALSRVLPSVSATSGKYNTPAHRPPSGLEGRAGGKGEVSLALPGVSSRDCASQDSINLSTSSLFKGEGDFPTRRCLDEWLAKIRIRFLPFLPRRCAPVAAASSCFFRVRFSATGKHPGATNDAAASTGNWQI